eukprot:6658097-Prymnesium_polylepis.3
MRRTAQRRAARRSPRAAPPQSATAAAPRAAACVAADPPASAAQTRAPPPTSAHARRAVWAQRGNRRASMPSAKEHSRCQGARPLRHMAHGHCSTRHTGTAAHGTEVLRRVACSRSGTRHAIAAAMACGHCGNVSTLQRAARGAAARGVRRACVRV